MGCAIIVSKTTSGSVKSRAIIEKSGQTYLSNIPVMVEVATGAIKEWDGSTVAAGIAGISGQPGSNLGTTGAGAPAPMAPYTGLGSGLTYGSVQNQASAKLIARGGPFIDGRALFTTAEEDVQWECAVGAAQTTVVTDVGVNYGLTKDSDGLWYVDRTKTAGNACLKIIALHPLDGAKLGGRVIFKFLASAIQLSN